MVNQQAAADGSGVGGRGASERSCRTQPVVLPGGGGGGLIHQQLSLVSEGWLGVSRVSPESCGGRSRPQTGHMGAWGKARVWERELPLNAASPCTGVASVGMAGETCHHGQKRQ